MSEDELRVLDKGLKFTPVRNFSKFHAHVNIQKFVRTLNIKKYFLAKLAERTAIAPVGIHSNLSNKSVFNLPNVDSKHIAVFRNMVISDLDLESMKVKKVRVPS